MSRLAEPLPLPTEREWARIGVVLGDEIRTGHQSRVFRATLDGSPAVLKLSDGRFVDDFFSRRVEMLSSLAEECSAPVGPLDLGSGPVVPLGGWLVVAFPFVAATAPDPTRRSDVRALATTLASLHRSMERLGPVDLLEVRALRDSNPVDGRLGFSAPQLLHGDYGVANTLLAPGGLRVVDFDECGYGPVEFEIGNTLYMVLFDAWMTADRQRYDDFRAWFVPGYRAASGRVVDDATLDAATGRRVEALRRWIDDPERAPIGISTATPAWRDTLRAFVGSNPTI